MRRLGLCIFLTFFAACGDDGASDNGGSDNGGSIDAAPGTADADPTLPDADPNKPDAIPNTVMSFFVTSTGNGANGGNLGGLSGADSKCQRLAADAGAGGRTWRAYLSTDNPQVHARDRIGTGPWFNQQGVMVAADLTSLHQNIAGPLILTELGEVVPSDPLDHDVLTGSTADGRVMTGKTCRDWTDSTADSGGQVGHADIPEEDLGDQSWNSQHDPQCSEEALRSTAGTGRIYCFAID